MRSDTVQVSRARAHHVAESASRVHMASVAMAAVMATLAAVSPVRVQDMSPAASCSYTSASVCTSRSPGSMTCGGSAAGGFSSAWSFGDGSSRSLRQHSTRRGSGWSQRQQLRVVAKDGDEISYVMVKPDGVQRGLVGEIISRFERKGFKLKGLKLIKTPQDLAEQHYEELKERPFFGKLVRYIVSGPVVAMAWEGPGVVASARKLIGVTNPLQADPGTIRGDFGVEVGRNVVHGSDSPENGKREVALWFEDDELVEWEQELTPWLRE